jgi:hypothetical protein
MKLRDFIEYQALKVSNYPFDGYIPSEESGAEIRHLRNCNLVDYDIPLSVGNKSFQLLVTILPRKRAVIWRGFDDLRWDLPILCLDEEAFCFELLEWREKIGLVAKKSVPPFPLGSDEFFEMLVAELQDPFINSIDELA